MDCVSISGAPKSNVDNMLDETFLFH